MSQVSPAFPERLLRRLPMVAGIAALIAGLWTSLARLGLPAEGIVAVNHGPLMVGGFVGTVIALERAVALGRPWGYAAPILGALSALVMLLSAPYQVAALFLFMASLVLLAIFAVFFQRGTSEFLVIMALGAVLWTVGNLLLYAGWTIPHVVPWWAGFLILTIAGERIELSRLRPRSVRTQRITLGLIVLYMVTLFITFVDHDLSVRLGGVVLIGVTIALAHGDLARWTKSSKGVAGYAAWAILTGYVWLALYGLFGAVFGQTHAGYYYDAWTHSIFVGFVLVMIMAHAPIILPAVAGVPIAFNSVFYVPVILLQLSLALRIVADLLQSWNGRQWTGVVNVASVLLFMVIIAVSAVRGTLDRK